MIVAGEASGDAHAAALVDALRAMAPGTQFEFFGATGRQMRAAGVDSVVRADELSILGLWEIARALPKFWSAFGELKHAATERKPDAAILVDWPDFNLRLARWLHRRGIKVIYYVSPQLWAWRSYRVVSGLHPSCALGRAVGLHERLPVARHRGLGRFCHKPPAAALSGTGRRA